MSEKEEIASFIHAAADAFDAENTAKMSNVVDAVVRQYPPEQYREPEFPASVVRYDLSNIWGEVVKRYFPAAVENRRYRNAIVYWDAVYRSAGNLVEERHDSSACCMDCGRFIANAYVKYALDGTLPDMSIGERCYWKPEFGSAEAWMEFCEAVVRFERGHDAKALCEAYSRL